MEAERPQSKPARRPRKRAAQDAPAEPPPVAADAPVALVETAPSSRACVIGAGLGGLAVAIRLQASGIPTVLIEARDRAGGCACGTEADGFVFDGGPTSFTDPGAFAALWSLSGHDMADAVEFLPVAPLWRLNWPDGTQFDLLSDQIAMVREIARHFPDDLGGYEDFLDYCAGAAAIDLPMREGRGESGAVQRLGALLGKVPGWLRHQAWRSAHSLAGGFVRDRHFRDALSFQLLLRGANPLSTGALGLQSHREMRGGGMWWPKGGVQALVDAMLRQFERIGGTVRLHDPVVRLHAIGNRLTEVETQSGWRERFDAVVSNADPVHTHRELLADTAAGGGRAARITRRRFSPSAFIVHFALEGSWPGIPHHMVLFGPRYEGLLTDVFEHGVLPQDQMIFLDHPSVTDASLAPAGKSVFRAMIPVANQGKLPIDWETVGPMLERRVLGEVGRRLIPDIGDRIISVSHYTPRDFALDLNAYQGSAWGLESHPLQTGLLRPGPRDRQFGNLYRVGASARPGAGVPGVLASAEAAARAMQEDMK